jgi:hypothetical protein
MFIAIAICLHGTPAPLPRGGGAGAGWWEGRHVAAQRQARCEFVVVECRIGAESGALGVGLQNYRCKKLKENSK